MSRLVTAMVTAMIGACSFRMKAAPAQLPDSGGVDCSDRVVRPLFDGFGAVGAAGLSIYAFADLRGRDCEAAGQVPDCLFDRIIGVTMLLPATVYAAAAVTGITRWSRCRSRRAAYAARARPNDGLWVTCRTVKLDGVWGASYVIENLNDRAIDYQFVARMSTRDRSWVSPTTDGRIGAGRSVVRVFRPFGVGEEATGCTTDWISERR